MACNSNQTTSKTPSIEDFDYTVDKFEDIEILRYRVPDFETLTLQQKTLVYYLNQAALEGRDILYDQNGAYNLLIRRIFESVYENYEGDRESADFQNVTTYLKQIWMGNGIYHHYGSDKFTPKFSFQYLTEILKTIPAEKLPLAEGETIDKLPSAIWRIIFDPAILAKRVNQAEGEDLILTSAENYYGKGITQQEVEDFYNNLKDTSDTQPVAYGLNSKLVKENGVLTEKTYKIGGLYSAAIERIVFWLEKAATVAENDAQKDVILSLIEFYKTGSLVTYDQYAIKWVADVNSLIDFVNGFTESYGDPLGMKGSWESIVNFKNLEATKRTAIISQNAQWFESNSPVAQEYKKDKVKGISAKVITATILAGDCYPSTPIGINLPNSNWIRAEHGSKSVTIENITEAYDRASLGNGFTQEFYWSDTECELVKNFGTLTDNLHTDLHECLGHASGKLLPGVDQDALKAYGSTIEEARADLFGLYYLADKKMLELGLIPDANAYKAEYYKYITNGLMTQLTRILPGKNIEEAHMRNRSLIARWCYEKGKANNVIEFRVREGETFVVVNNYEKLRTLFGELLAEIQRIKSTGDFDAGKALVENYGVKVDAALHTEILSRYKKLNIAPYKGFVNPVYSAVTNKEGKITDITIDYSENYVEQNLRYSKQYSVLGK
ncbi:MAG: dipeptidyl peptidase 3 [Paludibacter sp.]|nr:dipeptidyl peptidase 3 [Paludibacter sp.]